jgi:phospholipid-binding lipoprotein MlaA
VNTPRSASLSVARIGVALAVVALVGCASPTKTAKATEGSSRAPTAAPGLNPVDPWEPFNRTVFELNERIDRNFLVPLATAYKNWVPTPVAQGFGNVLSHAADIWSAANHLLQGKPQEAAETSMRFAVNTVFGLAGVLDVASEMGLERRSEDFGQTLGVWGFQSGPFLVLPLLGPSSLRDGLALPLDRSTGLMTWIDVSAAGAAALTFAEVTHVRSRLLGASSLLDQVSLDRYSFVRDSYLARRRNDVFDGNPPPEPEEAEEPTSKSPVKKSQ